MVTYWRLIKLSKESNKKSPTYVSVCRERERACDNDPSSNLDKQYYSPIHVDYCMVVGKVPRNLILHLNILGWVKLISTFAIHKETNSHLYICMCVCVCVNKA